jgi:tetratricopeptide (TPR) repeat protein
MKKIKEITITVLIILAGLAVVLFIYNHTSSRSSRELAKRIAEINPRGSPASSIEGLRQAIALYEEQIERNVREGAQTGVYWKILGIRLADRNMHRDALAAFERAIHFNTEDASIFYHAGVSAASVAKSIVGFSANSQQEREHFFNLAENSQLRAIELDITYSRPMYALGVLYAFELDRPQDAIYHLERYLQLVPSGFPAMFVLARAFFMLEDFSRAIEIYDRIIDRSRDSKTREEAMILRDVVQGMIYG